METKRNIWSFEQIKAKLVSAEKKYVDAYNKHHIDPVLMRKKDKDEKNDEKKQLEIAKKELLYLVVHLYQNLIDYNVRQRVRDLEKEQEVLLKHIHDNRKNEEQLVNKQREIEVSYMAQYKEKRILRDLYFRNRTPMKKL
jgi:hypothetical protein